MKKTNNKIAIFALFILIFSVMSSNIITGIGLNPKSNANPIPILPDKDTYVDSVDPTSNFGGQDYLYIGDDLFGDINIAYVHFNFTQKPTTFEKVYLQIDPNIISETMNFTVRLHDSSEPWDELTLTYLNQPTNIIDNLDYRFKYDDRSWIELTSFFDSHTLTELYLSINASIFHETYFTTYSKETDYSFVDPISLLFLESGDEIDMSYDIYETSEFEILPTMDSFIDSGNAYSNYGGQDNMEIGTGIFDDIYASIIRFENIPTNATEITLTLDLWSVYETVDLLITIYSGVANLQDWNEFDLNWMNWPYESAVNLMLVENVNLTEVVSSSGVVSVDLSNWVGNDTLDIVLTLPLTTEEYIYCYTYEGYSILGDPPLLSTDISSVPDTDPNGDPDGDPNGDPEDTDEIAGFPLIGVICLLTLGVILKKSKKGNYKIR
jgi:hypothetical protein